jgi:CheY-like chemotaxis protein
MTAFARDDDRERARKAGFHDHLSKPVDPDVLISVIMKLLQKR